MRALRARCVGVCAIVVFAIVSARDASRLQAATAPFSGTPAAIPGTIEAENFDNGGEGVAYHDTTSGNTGGQYRSTGVDIEAANTGGYDVGWIAAGEWLNYTVNVSAAGSYAAQLRVASPNGGSLHLKFNGVPNVSVTVTIPATGGWQNWTTVRVPLTLGAGTQQMTIAADTAGFNLDSFTISSGGSPGGSPAPTPTLSPYSGTPASIPGTIEAENFDNGGEGVAFHDTTAGNTGGQYRSTNVDIEAASPGGYDVGWIDAGEWLKYTVNVTAAGSYAAQLRVASPTGASMHLAFGGVSTAVTIPGTGGWQNWTTVSVPLTLAAGKQQMTIAADTGGFNVDNVTITIGAIVPPAPLPALSPYSGAPVSIPGTIEAENFDNGGEGVAFHDTTAGNTGGQYRSTNVDIEAASGGGYNVGWIDAGEWLKYTVNVTAAGGYTAQVRVASPTGASMHLAFGGVSTAIAIPATGGWQNWTIVSLPVTLAAGTQQMTLLADTAGFNVDSVSIGLGVLAPTATVSIALTSPAGGSRFTAPAAITFTATALSTVGTVSTVEFFNGSTMVGTSTTAPYGGTWSNVQAGTYSLLARATSSGGVAATSSVVTVTVDSPTSSPSPAPTAPVTSGALVQASNLVYLGSFRVPPITVAASGNSFDYGGTAPAFNPARNSIYLVGHVHDQQTAELGIPATLGTGAVSSLPTASVLQPFADALEGHLQDVAAGQGDTNTHISGQFVYNGQLYVNPYVYYGTTGANAHYRRSMNLTAGGTLQGGYAIGGPLGTDFYTGYMGPVPAQWQAALGGPVLMGQCCISIIGRTSYGPSVSALDPAQLGSTPMTASTLVAYPQAHPTLGNWGDIVARPIFNGTSQVSGVVFPAGTSSVLFFGRTGTGMYCYGEATCDNDPEDSSKGDHAYPYVYYVWAYDAHDLAAVKAGTKQPWDVKPYATWPITFPTSARNHYVGGATYDPATGRIFISQQYADGDMPVIHVYTIK